MMVDDDREWVLVAEDGAEPDMDESTPSDEQISVETEWTLVDDVASDEHDENDTVSDSASNAVDALSAPCVANGTESDNAPSVDSNDDNDRDEVGTSPTDAYVRWRFKSSTSDVTTKTNTTDGTATPLPPSPTLDDSASTDTEDSPMEPRLNTITWLLVLYCVVTSAVAWVETSTVRLHPPPIPTASTMSQNAPTTTTHRHPRLYTARDRQHRSRGSPAAALAVGALHASPRSSVRGVFDREGLVPINMSARVGTATRTRQSEKLTRLLRRYEHLRSLFARAGPSRDTKVFNFWVDGLLSLGEHVHSELASDIFSRRVKRVPRNRTAWISSCGDRATTTNTASASFHNHYNTTHHCHTGCEFLPVNASWLEADVRTSYQWWAHPARTNASVKNTNVLLSPGHRMKSHAVNIQEFGFHCDLACHNFSLNPSKWHSGFAPPPKIPNIAALPSELRSHASTTRTPWSDVHAGMPQHDMHLSLKGLNHTRVVPSMVTGIENREKPVRVNHTVTDESCQWPHSHASNGSLIVAPLTSVGHYLSPWFTCPFHHAPTVAPSRSIVYHGSAEPQLLSFEPWDDFAGVGALARIKSTAIGTYNPIKF